MRWLKANADIFGLLAALLILLFFLSLASPYFFRYNNISDIFREMSFIMIIGIGMTMVIVSGEIDLSVGSLVAAAGILLGFLLIPFGMPPWLAAPLVIVAGALVGTIPALIRNLFNVPTFITSLGMLSIYRGIALTTTKAAPISPLPDGFNLLSDGGLFKIPYPVLIMLLLFFAGLYLLHYTRTGRFIYAMGSNMEAARLSGVRIERVRLLAFAVLGALSALTAVILSSRLMSATPTVAEGWELNVIAAVIVGGTALSGGRGKLVGTFIGALFIAVLNNGMILLGVSSFAQLIVKGLLIISAVLLNAAYSRSRGFK